MGFRLCIVSHDSDQASAWCIQEALLKLVLAWASQSLGQFVGGRNDLKVDNPEL